jgi:hypothetical protein
MFSHVSMETRIPQDHGYVGCRSRRCTALPQTHLYDLIRSADCLVYQSMELLGIGLVEVPCRLRLVLLELGHHLLRREGPCPNLDLIEESDVETRRVG